MRIRCGMPERKPVCRDKKQSFISSNTLSWHRLAYCTYVPVMDQAEIRWSMGHQREQTPDATPLSHHIHPDGSWGSYLSPWRWPRWATVHRRPQRLLNVTPFRLLYTWMLGRTIKDQELPGNEPQHPKYTADIVYPFPGRPGDDITENRIEHCHAHRAAQIGANELTALVGRNPFGCHHMHRGPSQTLKKEWNISNFGQKLRYVKIDMNNNICIWHMLTVTSPWNTRSQSRAA